MDQVKIPEAEVKVSYFRLSKTDVKKLSDVRRAYKLDLTGASKSQTIAKCIDHVYNHVINNEEF